MRRIVLVSCLFVTGLVLLGGCFQAKPPTGTGDNGNSLFTIKDLDTARITSILSEAAIQATDLNNTEVNLEGGKAPDESNGDIAPQAVLPSVSGYLAYYRENGSTYEIWVANQKDDSKTNVYSSNYPIQSVAVSGDGKWVTASIKNATGFNDVYLFDLMGKTTANLTNSSSKNELDVSISFDASKIVFTRPSTGGLNRITICAYSSFSNSCTFSTLAASVEQTQASISGNSNYIALVRKVSNSENRVLLYNVITKTYTTVFTANVELSDPSPSDDGNSVMFLKDEKATTGKYVSIVKNLSTNQLSNLLSSPTLDHPHLTADAMYFSYDTAVTGQQRVFTRNISTSTKATAAGGTWNYQGHTGKKVLLLIAPQSLLQLTLPNLEKPFSLEDREGILAISLVFQELSDYPTFQLNTLHLLKRQVPILNLRCLYTPKIRLREEEYSLAFR